MIRLAPHLLAVLPVLVASCGGGGSGSLAAAPLPEPPSAGGVWASGAGPDSLLLFIAEDGDVLFAGADFSIGTGTVTVSAGGQLSGSLRRVVRSPISGPLPPVPPLPPGAPVTQRFDFAYVSSAHARPSSAGGLAGNYPLSRPGQCGLRAADRDRTGAVDVDQRGLRADLS